MGINRGKTDELAAIRIAEYAYRFTDKAILWQPEDESISRLRHLQSKRDILVKTQKQIKQSMDGKFDSEMRPALDVLKKAIGKLELKMNEVIKANQKLARYNELLDGTPKNRTVSLVHN